MVFESITVILGTNQLSRRMNISSAQIFDRSDERYESRLDHKTIQVVLRRGFGVTSLRDFDNIAPNSEVHVVIASTADSAKRVRKALAEAFNGDTVLVYYCRAELRADVRRELRVGRPRLAAVA